MLYNLSKAINWKAITERKCKQIACYNEQENAAHIENQYQVGDRVLKRMNCILCNTQKEG
jgi:hypothetical protein